MIINVQNKKNSQVEEKDLSLEVQAAGQEKANVGSDEKRGERRRLWLMMINLCSGKA